MGWRSTTHFTIYHYFARAKRKKTQQGWAVITLEVDAVLGRVQIAVHWLASFVCDKGQVQCLMTPFIMRNSETMFVRRVQIIYLLSFPRARESAARHVVILYCIVLYFKKVVSQGASSERSKTLTYSRTRFEPRSGGTRNAPSKGAEVPGRCLRHLCPTQSKVQK